MKANYHTHTFRCRHANGSDREYVEAALRGGLRILGFADHTPFPRTEDGTGMMPVELPDYIECLTKLREEYKDQIKIYIGLEVENSPTQLADLARLLMDYPLDYLILGQHTVFGLDDYRKPVQKTADPKHFTTYCKQVTQAIKSGLFTYWAHPDVINFIGDDELYKKEMRKLCRLAKEHGLPLEINFHGALLGLNYPADRFWEIAASEGNEVVFGCDAHEPTELYDREKTESIANRLVRKYDLKLLDTVNLKKPNFSKFLQSFQNKR